MTGGNSPICYLKAYHTNLYLSSDAEKVSGAIEEGESGVQPGGWGGCPEPTGVGARSDSSSVPMSMCRWGGFPTSHQGGDVLDAPKSLQFPRE